MQSVYFDSSVSNGVFVASATWSGHDKAYCIGRKNSDSIGVLVVIGVFSFTGIYTPGVSVYVYSSNITEL